MSEEKHRGVPFDGAPEEQQLWDQLSQLNRAEPGPALRSRFYEALSEASRPTLAQRLVSRFGNVSLWLPAVACMVIGLGLGLALNPSSQGTGSTDQLVALQEQVSDLNRRVLLDQLEQASTNARLRGVIAAGELVADDPDLARALLRRASQDQSASVRSAAIDALGPQIARAEVGDELMGLLEGAESPLVQLALVDLVLRHGTARQVRLLLDLARAERLHPDLVPYVTSAVEPTEA